MNMNEQQMATQAIGPNKETLASAVARLYYGRNGKWTWAEITGAVVLSKEEESFYITIVEFQSKRIAFQQELYYDFEYVQARPFFHTFETDTDVAGLSFASEIEAKNIFTAISKVIELNLTSGNPAPFCPPRPLPRPSPPAVPRSAITIRESSPRTSAENVIQPTSYDDSYLPSPSAPPPMRRPPPPPPNRSMNSPSNFSPPSLSISSSPSFAPPSSPPEIFSTSSSSSQSSSPTMSTHSAPSSNITSPTQNVPIEKRSRRATASVMFSKAKNWGVSLKDGVISAIKKKEDEDLVISEPDSATFQHISSIGWTQTKGFEIRNIPPEWKRLFRDAGIQPKHLRDKETAAQIYGVISQETGGTMSLGGNQPPQNASKASRPPPPIKKSMSQISSPTDPVVPLKKSSSQISTPTISLDDDIPPPPPPFMDGPSEMMAPSPSIKKSGPPVPVRVPPPPPQNSKPGSSVNYDDYNADQPQTSNPLFMQIRKGIELKPVSNAPTQEEEASSGAPFANTIAEALKKKFGNSLPTTTEDEDDETWEDWE